MGNNLCKERIDRAENSKNPVDRVIGRCAQICPKSFGNNKTNSNYWKNNILETGPPTRSQPKSSNEWRSNTLNIVPQSDPLTNKLTDIPIPPPRKKRNTLQRTQNNWQPGGFKEVFGTPSRRSSTDSIDKFPSNNSNSKRRNSSDDFTDFSKDTSLDNPGVKRKISKVGNKKSDKFLGENLSDCLSNSPFLASTPILAKKADDLSTTLPKDALDSFVDSNVTKHDFSQNISKIMADRIEQPKIDKTVELHQNKSAPIEMHIQYSKEPETRPSLLNAAKTTVNNFKDNVDNMDKRAEFLMTMVDHEFNNTNVQPEAEEVLSPPKRRRSKNISNEEVVVNASNTTDRSEVVENVVGVIRNEQVLANRNLKLELSSPEKKKEFPKSNPDSPNIYAHLKPIEHELIVPVRLVTKHICDDDEHIHKHKHGHAHAHPKSMVSPTDQSDGVEEVVEAMRSSQVDANRNLKLDLSATEKKKEFPKSNPDSPNIYAHLQPVEHELIVPVRKHYKHICDDDHVHKHIHGHGRSHDYSNKDVVDGKFNDPANVVDHLVKVEQHKIQENISPKKPDRDFSRYRKSEDLSILEEPIEDESLDSIIESQILRPERKKGRSISRESLPAPPPRPIRLDVDRKISLPEPVQPVFKSRKISLQEPMRGLFEDQKLPDTPVTPINTPILNDNEYEKIETFLKKCSSSQSFLTKELMDQLVDKVYGYSRNWDDQMEDGMLHTKCNDGSEKVGPSSKLTTRKISVIKKDPPAIVKIKEDVEEVKKPTFSIGSTDLQKEMNATNVKEEPVTLKPSPVTVKSDDIPATNLSSHIKRTDTVLELLTESAVKTTNNSSQPKEAPTVKSLSTTDTPSADLDVVKVLLKSTEIHPGSETNALEDIYKKNQDIMDDFKDYLEDKKINEEMMKVADKTEVKEIIDEEIDKSHSLFPDHISIDSFDSADNSDSETDTTSYKNRRLGVVDEPRRGSIVDHDQWFLRHRDLPNFNQGRRGSDCPTTFDTYETYDTYEKKSKSSNHVNLDGSNELDHSTLLKYFPTNNLSDSGK